MHLKIKEVVRRMVKLATSAHVRMAYGVTVVMLGGGVVVLLPQCIVSTNPPA